MGAVLTLFWRIRSRRKIGKKETAGVRIIIIIIIRRSGCIRKKGTEIKVGVINNARSIHEFEMYFDG